MTPSLRPLLLGATIAAISLLTSCATLLNHDTMQVRIETRPPGLSARLDDTLLVQHTPFSLTLRRSPDDHTLSFSNDSVRKDISLDSRLSRAYWLGDIYPSFGIGYIIDAFSDRRFGYEETVFVDLYDSTNTYPVWRDGMAKPGDVRFGFVASLSIAPMQIFVEAIDTGADRWLTAGANALAASMDYFHSHHMFVGAEAGLLNNIFGECFDSCGPRLTTAYASVSHGYNWLDFWASYGVQFSYSWIRPSPQNMTVSDYAQDIRSLGFVLKGGVRLWKPIYLVVDYVRNAQLDQESPLATNTYQFSIGVRFLFGRTSPFD